MQSQLQRLATELGMQWPPKSSMQPKTKIPCESCDDRDVCEYYSICQLGLSIQSDDLGDTQSEVDNQNPEKRPSAALKFLLS